MSQSALAPQPPLPKEVVAALEGENAKHLPLVTRRRLEVALGALWMLDGLLQFQPYMFGRSFFDNVLGMASMGVPAWFARLPHDLLGLLAPAHVWFNALFALSQVAIGAGLMSKRASRPALVASFVWGLSVWVVGEGFGGMFMPGMSLLNGAPGAAVLYVAMSIVVWPTDRPVGRSVASSSPIGQRGVLAMWVMTWAGTALLELETANNAPEALAPALRYWSRGEPGPLAWIDRSASELVGNHGTEAAFLLMAIQVIVGLQVLQPTSLSRRRAFLAVGMGLSALYWVVGQDLGGILTGTGTDPGTAPLVVLMALALWPASNTGEKVASTPGTNSIGGTATRRHRPLRWIAACTTAALVALVGVAVTSPGRGSSRVDQGTTVVARTSAPPFHLVDLENSDRAISLQEFRGRFVVLNFWASWCAPCRQEMPALQAASVVLGPNVGVVGIDTNDNRLEALAFAHQVGARYLLAFDPGGQLAPAYGAIGLPTTVFVSPDGQELARHFGPFSASGLVETARGLMVRR